MLFWWAQYQAEKKKVEKLGVMKFCSLPISQFMEEPAEIHLSNINYRDFHE